VNPSTPRPKGRSLPSARAQAEGSGFTLSGVFHSVLKDGASRRRMGEYETGKEGLSANIFAPIKARAGAKRLKNL